MFRVLRDSTVVQCGRTWLHTSAPVCCAVKATGVWMFHFSRKSFVFLRKLPWLTLLSPLVVNSASVTHKPTTCTWWTVLWTATMSYKQTHNTEFCHFSFVALFQTHKYEHPAKQSGRVKPGNSIQLPIYMYCIYVKRFFEAIFHFFPFQNHTGFCQSPFEGQEKGH